MKDARGLEGTKEDRRAEASKIKKMANGLSPLNAILDLIQDKNLADWEILQQSVNLVRAGLQHPDKACVRITVGKQRFASSNFRKTKWKQVHRFQVNGNHVGSIEAYYTADKYPPKKGDAHVKDTLYLEAVGKCLYLYIHNRKIIDRADRSRDLMYWIPEKTYDAICITDLNGVMLFTSPLAAKRMGYQPSELIGQKLINYIPDFQVDHVQKALNSVAQGKTVDRLLYSALSKDGKHLKWEMHAEPVFEGDKAVGCLIISRDVTEEQNLQEALKISKERFSILAGQVSDTIWAMDMNLRFTYISPNVLNMRGYTVNEAMEQGLDQILTTASYNAAIKEFIGVMAARDPKQAVGKGSRTLELEQICKDGSTVWTEVRISLIADPDGEPAGIVGVTRDISERKIAEARLLASEKRYRGLYDSIRDGMVIVTPEGEILDANKTIQTNLGYSLDELRKTDYRTLCAEDSQTNINVIGENLRVLGYTADLEVKLIRKDGTIFPALIRAWYTPEGKSQLIWVFIRDISKRRQAEEQLRALSNRLINAQEEERRRISMELHDELGQIMTALKLSLEIAERSAVKDRRERIHDAQFMLNDLMVRTRNISLDLWPAMLDNLGLIPTLAWYFERYTMQTGIKVAFRHANLAKQLAQELKIAVYRIVQEALTNVARHAGVAQVAVSMKKEHGILFIHIQDSGKGFDVEKLLTASTSIGLTGIKERAEVLGGTLQIESTAGKGTSLFISLPLSHHDHEGARGNDNISSG